MFVAACEGDFSTVKSLLKQGHDPNERSFVNFPEERIYQIVEKIQRCSVAGLSNDDIEKAVSSDTMPTEAVNFLLGRFFARQQNPNEYYAPENGIPTLHFPVLHKHNEIVFALLDAGADPDSETLSGLFPLYVAAENGNLPVVKRLLEKGATMEKKTPLGNTALRNAVEEGHYDVVKYLIENGADIYSVNNAGNTILDAAIYYGHHEIESLVKSHQLSRFNASFLIEAINTGNNLSEDVIRAGIPTETNGERFIGDIGDLKESLEKEAVDVCCGKNGQRAMHLLRSNRKIALAIVKDPYNPNHPQFRDYHVFEAFREAGLEDEAIGEIYLQTIRNYHLVKAVVEGRERLLSVALESGADVNGRCYFEGVIHTPIVAAARSGKTSICKQLIDAGANPNQPQANGETALANAVMLDDPDMVHLLLEAHANPNATMHIGTALCIAPNSKIVKLLLDYGADPNIPDFEGDLPIIARIDNWDIDSIRMLLDAGTDINRKNLRGISALAHAASSDSQPVRRLFSGFAN